MRYHYIAFLFIILLLVGCAPKEPPKEPITPAEKPIEEPAQTCTEIWLCQDENTKAYRKSDCAFEQITDCPAGCESGECKKEPIKEPIKEPEEQNETEEEAQPELSEEEQIQQIFKNSKKLTSYSYRYKDPSGPQYTIYVKGNKIRIDYISNNYQIYLDTEKKTAEKWCISHTNCGKEVGKIADLDYYDAYIETPIDWLAKITTAKKIDEGFYYGKQSWMLDTNIGEVIIDVHFGFISSIKKEDKIYLFTESSLNTVKESDVNIPEYLINQ